jgi:lysophospholipase L1-like esterase
MMECVILGDSIAQGVSRNFPACAHRVKVGITSEQFVRSMMQPVNGRHVLISLGSNDGHAQTTLSALTTMRSQITHSQVTWLLSSNNASAAQAAQQVARLHGDRMISVSAWVGPDRVHPTTAGYHRLSQMWRHN